MKTTRRQELRTNDLSQQLAQIKDYVSTNMTAMTAVVVGAAVLTIGVYWFVAGRRATLMQAWTEVYKPSAT